MFDAMALSPVFSFDHSAKLPVCFRTIHFLRMFSCEKTANVVFARHILLLNRARNWF